MLPAGFPLGKKYYACNGAYYQPFSNGGKTIYMVVDDPTASH